MAYYHEQYERAFVVQQRQRIELAKTRVGKPREKQDSFKILASLYGGPSVLPKPSPGIAIIIGDPYPPSTRPLKELEPLSLSQLRQETHHRGKFILVKLTGLCSVVHAGILTAVQDDDGDVEFLKLSFLFSNQENILRTEGEMVVIKEPFLTHEELQERSPQCLRVDHLSDIMPLRSINSEVVPPILSSRRGKCRPPGERKELDNAAVKQKDYVRAHDYYTEGLRTFEVIADGLEQELKHHLLRNRACSGLHLGRYEDAMADALAAVSHVDDAGHRKLDSRAYYHAGRACYGLQMFEQSRNFFRKQLDLTTDDATGVSQLEKIDGAAHLEKVAVRLQEQRNGEYNLEMLPGSLSKERPRLEAASFVCNTEVNDTGTSRGRGLFATRDLRFGDLVLAEKAFCSVWCHERPALGALKINTRDLDHVIYFPFGLYREVVLQVSNNASLAGRIQELYGDYDGIGKAPCVIDGRPVVDSFQIHDVVARNSFGLTSYVDNDPKDPALGISSALWVRTSYLNTSCVPNSNFVQFGDLMLIHATKPIAKGEEVTIYYDGNQLKTYEDRKSSTIGRWKFECTCALCVAESVDSVDVRKRRSDLESQADQFIRQYHPMNPRPAITTINMAEKIASEIASQYDKKRFDGLPRVGLSDIQYWLCVAWSSQLRQLKNAKSNSQAAAVDYLRSLAYQVQTKQGRIICVRPTTHSRVAPLAVQILISAILDNMDARDTRTAKSLFAFAREMSLALHGNDHEFKKRMAEEEPEMVVHFMRDMKI